MKVILNAFFILICSLTYSQIGNLSEYRKTYCMKNCKKYKHEQELIVHDIPSPPPNKIIYPKFKRVFSIPLEKRNEIYPFNRYDSIYVVSPNYINEKEKNRNYLDKKFHRSLRLISLEERNKLSDILFNYYKLNSLHQTGLFNPEDEDICIQSRYPKMILLFMKRGKFIKYVAFPDEGFERYNFSDKEYENLDWSVEKENMILDMFKKDILPDQNCNVGAYYPNK